MWVTPPGIVTLLRLRRFQNAQPLISVTLSGITIEVRSVQPEKAPSHISFTPSEITTDFSFLQGAAGDVSSRFIRDGQTYDDVEKLGNRLLEDIDKLFLN